MINTIITSSVLIMAVIVIRFLARGKISPILQYALWLPVALRLMLPVPLWNSSISILNFLPESLQQESSDLGSPSMGVMAASANNVAVDMTDDNTDMQFVSAEKPISARPENGGYDRAADNGEAGSRADIFPASTETLESGLAGIVLTWSWIVGIVCVGGYMLFYQIKWKQYLKENAKPLKGREKYRNKLSVYTVKGLPSPCLSGKKIYLTKEMASDERRLEHILMHEYCHYRHFDFVWVIVRCALTTIYWFHPLVWAAAYLSKQDSELACDEAALRQLGEKERIAYGKTLLSLIVQEPCERNRIGMVSTMSGKEKGIRERILRIAKTRNYIAAVSVIVIILAAGLVAVTFSGKSGEDGQDSKAGTADETLTDDMQSEVEKTEALEALLQEKEEELKILQEEAERQNAEAALEALQQEKEEELKILQEELEKQNTEAMFSQLASYDERISLVGSTTGITDAKNPADYRDAYAQNGEEVLAEDVYLLERRKGADNSDIKIYGMYTKEFGFRGIKILVGDDVNDFDIPWSLSFHGLEENVSVYEFAEDGMPRTFACKMAAVDNRSSEIWNLYLCDRYDTGTIALYTPDTEDFLKQIQERMSFEIIPDECQIDVYDNGKKAGSIKVAASASSMEKIKEVVCDSSAIGYSLGKNEEEIRLLVQIGLKKEQSGDIWYRDLNLLSFKVTCEDFGERNLQLGEVSVDMQHVSQTRSGQGENSIDEWVGEAKEEVKEVSENILEKPIQNTETHYDIEIQYQNPCPAATRISDTFGERTSPVTQEKRTHFGIDFAAPEGSDVLAAADGVVIQAGFDDTSGNFVILYHELSGEYTYYAACQEILVSNGEEVNAGDKIATVGSTGRSTGSHLHFAVSRAGEYVEPVFIELDE